MAEKNPRADKCEEKSVSKGAFHDLMQAAAKDADKNSAEKKEAEQ